MRGSSGAGGKKTAASFFRTGAAQPATRSASRTQDARVTRFTIGLLRKPPVGQGSSGARHALRDASV